MPWRSPVSCAACGAPKPPGARCTCRRSAPPSAERAEQARGYARNAHRLRFRRSVLRREPLCVLCGAPAAVADHYPRTRRELEAAGEDPNDPQFGRGLCKRCHDKHTAATTPGGWNARNGSST